MTSRVKTAQVSKQLIDRHACHEVLNPVPECVSMKLISRAGSPRLSRVDVI